MSIDNDTCQYLSAASLRAPDAFVESAWHRHAPFAFHLMAALKPRVFVELGTLAGFSYFCFCQAVKEYTTGTSCYAVDTWEGDEHAGFYSEEVYNSVQRLNEPYLSFSTLMRMSFGEAQGYFPDGSVDLLHIDGRHYYEDVKEDFQTWLPKLSENAVVIFHDTNVRERNFGVFRLFRELGETYPTFEFIHGHGLGVLARGEVPFVLKAFFEADQRQQNNFRGLYSELGCHIVGIMVGAHLSGIVKQKNEELAVLRDQFEQTRASLTENLAEAERGQRDELDRTREAFRHSYRRIAELVSDLDRTRSTLEHASGELVGLKQNLIVCKYKFKVKWEAVLRHPFSRKKRKQFRADRFAALLAQV